MPDLRDAAAPVDAGVVRVGIDENGLGPRLGPLVVTAVTARAHGAGVRRVERAPRGKLSERLGDSKQLVSYRDSALGEAWARALVARLRGAAPESPAAVLHALSLDTAEELLRPCPGSHATQCWGRDGEAFAAPATLVGAVEADLARLESRGVRVSHARVAVVCTERLNVAAARGQTRFQVDLHAMERLVLDAREKAGAELTAICGKVGGFDRYGPHFGPLAGRLHTVVEEGRARSEYAFPALGRVAFVRDADASHLLVCMASLVGKWVRDLLMARVVRYHRAEIPDLPDVSGYHDPQTNAFVAATRLSRQARGLPDRCFERTRAT